MVGHREGEQLSRLEPVEGAAVGFIVVIGPGSGANNSRGVEGTGGVMQIGITRLPP